MARDYLCQDCGRLFATCQGLGLHFSHKRKRLAVENEGDSRLNLERECRRKDMRIEHLEKVVGELTYVDAGKRGGIPFRACRSCGVEFGTKHGNLCKIFGPEGWVK